MVAVGGKPADRKHCDCCPLPSLCPEGDPAGLPAALLASVLGQRLLDAGETLYMAGEKRDSIWVVSEGALKTCELDLEGREHVVGFHGQGEVLGLERLEVAAHRGFAVALEPSRLCRIPVSRLVEQLTRMPELWRDVLGIAGTEIARAREIHRVMGQLQTGQRLAWFLLNASGPRRTACGCSRLEIVHLPMQRQEIASYLGMTLETVSRSFSTFQREGLLQVRGRRIELLNPAGLAELIPQARAAA